MLNEPTAAAVYTLAAWQKQLTEMAYDLVLGEKSREEIAKELIDMAGYFALNLDDMAEQIKKGEEVKALLSTDVR